MQGETPENGWILFYSPSLRQGAHLMTMVSYPMNVALGYSGPEDPTQWDPILTASLRDPAPPEIAGISIAVVGRNLQDGIPTWAAAHPPLPEPHEEEEPEEEPEPKPAPKGRASRSKKAQPPPPQPPAEETPHVGEAPEASEAEPSAAAAATESPVPSPAKQPPAKPGKPSRYRPGPEFTAAAHQKTQETLAKLGAQKGLPKKPAASTPFKPPKAKAAATPSPKKATPSKKVGGKVDLPPKASPKGAQRQLEQMLGEPARKKPKTFAELQEELAVSGDEESEAEAPARGSEQEEEEDDSSEDEE